MKNRFQMTSQIQTAGVNPAGLERNMKRYIFRTFLMRSGLLSFSSIGLTALSALLNPKQPQTLRRYFTMISIQQSLHNPRFSRISTLFLACFIFIAFGGVQQAIAATEANKAIVRRLHEEVWNQRKLSVVDEIISPTFVRHIPPNPDIRGPEGLKQYAIALLTGFPDFHLTTEDMIAEGDKVVNRFTARGTHKGEFLGIPPTGKPVIATGIGIFHIVGGLIEEDWLLLDNVGLLQQLGVIPPAGGEDYTWGVPMGVTGAAGAPEANKALDRRVFEEVFNQGKLSVVNEIFSPNYLRHEPPNPEQVLGVEGFKQFVTAFLTGFPDLHLTMEEQIAEGGNVVPRFTFRGTHTGEFLGIPPTGKKVMITGISIHRFADGKLVESWTKIDQLGLLQQLGVIPTPGAPTAETVIKEYVMVDQSRSPADWKQVLKNPKEIEVITLETGDIEVPRGLVLNLEAPAASRLPADKVWVKVYAHLIRHKVKGDFLIDTGYDKSFSETPYGNLECLVQPFGFSFKQKPGQDIKAQLEKHRAKLQGVFFTHLHPDHTPGVPDLPKDVTYVAGKGELQAYMAFAQNFECVNQLEGVKVLEEIDFSKARDMPPMGKAIDIFGDGSLWALWTPGHTEGHISYLVNRTDGPVL
ncbi:ester cyclase, partial [Candidatus Poribacteria bacterium]|nr:ester cyclase [Candidatus Poribacteria bacterium]